MRALRPALLSFWLLSLTGCEYDQFQIEITPQADGFRRELTAWHVRPSGDGSQPAITPLADEQLRELERIYGPGQPIEDGHKHRFSGSFQQPPGDIGGYGSYVRHDSPLGSLTIYCERFRGSADLESELAQRRLAADKLVDLLIGWLRGEMGEAPEWPAVEAFLDSQFRHDLKNLVTYAWTGNAAEHIRPDSGAEFAFRGWQYLCERGYLRAGELPQLARAVQRVEQDPALLLAAAQRWLARQIGIAEDQPVPASLAWLGDAQHVRRSLEQYVRQSDLYQAHLARWHEEHAGDEPAEPPSPAEAVGELVFRHLLGFAILGTVDRLEVRLHCGQLPMQTNGEWDESAGLVSWAHELAGNRVLPAFSYAAWTEPDTEFQRRHFGQVLLEGERLGEYVLWHQGLTADEAEQWNRFLQECRPDEQLRSWISDFRFSAAAPTADGESASDWADTPRRLLLEGLGEN